MQSILDASRYDTDKGSNNYLEKYDEYFSPHVGKGIHLLELGVKKGGSLLMWRDYFQNAQIAGLDIEPVNLEPEDRIHIFQGLQQDRETLNHIRKTVAPEGFDIIIDDASHIGELTKLSFWYLFDEHLKPGGIYVIEDWRTGYWGKWPDGKQYRFSKKSPIAAFRSFLDKQIRNYLDKGADKSNVFIRKVLNRIRIMTSERKLKSHQYGMVGFVKQLVDEMGMDMITSPERGSRVPHRQNKFLKLEISAGQVFIIKNPNAKTIRTWS